MLSNKDLITRLKQQPRHGQNWLADLINTLSDFGELAVEATGAVTGLSTALLGLDDTSSLLVRGLEKQLALNDKLIDSYVKVASKSLYLERRNKILNESFGINSKKAAELASSLQRAASAYGATGEQMMTYAVGIRKLIPGMNQTLMQGDKQYQGLVRVQQVLTTNLGLSQEQAADYSAFAGQRGKDIESQLGSQYALSKEIERSTGEIGVFKTIAEGIAATSADLQLQYGKIPGNLELAILKANKLGFSMKDLAAAGNNLLNIESSIGEELEYQLLSGRRLVGNDEARSDLQGKSLTNAFREATLRGDANTQADVLNTILEQEGKTLENNLFARQQMSKLLGMDEAALSRALQKKSILEDLPGGEALFDKTGDALLEAAKGMHASTEQLNELREVEDQRTTDDILKQILTVLSEGSPATKAVLENQGGYVAGAAARAKQQASGASGQQMLVNLSESSLKTLGKTLLGLEAGKETLSTIISSKEAVLNAEKATITTGGEESAISTGDVVSMPGTSGRVLTGPFGAFSLDDRDMIMAGDPNKMTGGGGSAADFMKAAAIIVAAINTQTSQLKQDSTFRPGLTGARY